MISKSLFGRSFNEFHGYDINNKIELFGKDNLFTDDLRMSSNTSNPTIIPNIDLVYVLSGRTTALKKDADKLKASLKDDFVRYYLLSKEFD